jgi:hypothetical protein
VDNMKWEDSAIKVRLVYEAALGRAN